MASHCPCCRGRAIDLGGSWTFEHPNLDCPGCPACAEKDSEIARLQSAARVMSRTINARLAEVTALQAATRRVVEALLNYRMQHDAIRDDNTECDCIDCDSGRTALADLVLVALRRE
jgi:hypothetical protein